MTQRGLCITSPAEHPLLLKCCFKCYQEIWQQFRSDYWTVQIENSKEDRNQKENRGKRMERAGKADSK